MSTPTIEPRTAQWEPTDGFANHAAFIARDLDGETFVFRRFATLSARTLLHRQSELIALENQLADFDREAALSSDLDLRWAQRNWDVFREKADAGHEGLVKREKLLTSIEEKLERYHRALLTGHEIAQLDRPSSRVYRACVKELGGNEVKEGSEASSGSSSIELGIVKTKKLGGRSSETIYDSRHDLVALKPSRSSSGNNDLLSRFLLDHWPFATEDLLNNNASDPHLPGERPQFLYFPESTLSRIVGTISALVAGILLIGSILTLYFVQSPDARLGLVMGFIVLFGIGLTFTTSASRDSIFAATAAYAAVLVVFVSGNLGAGNGPGFEGG